MVVVGGGGHEENKTLHMLQDWDVYLRFYSHW